MLTGAGLARVWHHARAHRFFSAAHGVGWLHDGSAAGQAKLGFGNNWVVAAIVVTLPFGTRPVALPVLATLAVKGGERSKPDLARDLVDVLAERFPDRRIDLVADAAYGAGSFAGLGHDMTITTRARSNAAFSEPTPPRTGKRGRPLRPARPPEHRHRAASGHRAVVPVEDRTLDPGHAHHPPPPNHRHPISAPSPRPATTQEILEVQQAWTAPKSYPARWR